MISIKTKIYILSKIFEVKEEEINEKFIQEELLLIKDWEEFEDMDNEEFYDQLLVIDEEDKESFITTIFGDYDDLEFIDFIGGFQELHEVSEDYLLEMIQDFLSELFSPKEAGEIKPIEKKENKSLLEMIQDFLSELFSPKEAGEIKPIEKKENKRNTLLFRKCLIKNEEELEEI